MNRNELFQAYVRDGYYKSMDPWRMLEILHELGVYFTQKKDPRISKIREVEAAIIEHIAVKKIPVDSAIKVLYTKTTTCYETKSTFTIKDFKFVHFPNCIKAIKCLPAGEFQIGLLDNNKDSILLFLLILT